MMTVPLVPATPPLQRVALVAVGLAALLGVALLVGAVLVKTKGAPEPLLPSPSTLSALTIELPSPQESDFAGEAVERPLFWASRRPLAEVVVDTQEAAPSGPDEFDKVSLVGLFSSGADAGVIVDVDGDRRRLMSGERVGQWTLSHISAGEAIFTRDGQRRTLTLEHALVDAPARPRQEPRVEEQEPVVQDPSPATGPTQHVPPERMKDE